LYENWVDNQKRKMRTFFYIFGITILLLMGCSKEREEDGFGTYYEFSYNDSCFVVLSNDTINITLINIRNLHRVDSNIVLEIKNESLLSDTIKFNLNVVYEGYSPVPSPQKYWTLRQDTLFYWYGYSPIIPHKQSESFIVSSNFQIQTSPRLTYFSIQKIVIRKSPNKQITFKLGSTFLPL
ncbi:MAG: hypothetical protein AAB255_06765, partial [Bacteroidota bacterium]